PRLGVWCGYPSPVAVTLNSISGLHRGISVPTLQMSKVRLRSRRNAEADSSPGAWACQASRRQSSTRQRVFSTSACVLRIWSTGSSTWELATEIWVGSRSAMISRSIVFKDRGRQDNVRRATAPRSAHSRTGQLACGGSAAAMAARGHVVNGGLVDVGCCHPPRDAWRRVAEAAPSTDERLFRA